MQCSKRVVDAYAGKEKAYISQLTNSVDTVEYISPYQFALAQAELAFAVRNVAYRIHGHTTNIECTDCTARRPMLILAYDIRGIFLLCT